MIRRALVATACLVITACGGSGGGSGGGVTPPPPPVITKAQAARFLRQATFGPTAAEIDRVVQLGYDSWLDQQFAAPPSLHTPSLKALGRAPTQVDRLDEWSRLAVRGNDQLRQRVAFALSQILVVSERSALGTFPTALTTYYDVLVRNAFGNYRTLMEEVTLNPGMGVYLSMLGNQKPDVARNIRPDENYARELMQLFTIGLVELNADGTVRRDAQGQPIPTYDQAVIENFAHVYTGWMFGGSAQFWLPSFDFEQPMQPFDAFHDMNRERDLGDPGFSLALIVQVELGGRRVLHLRLRAQVVSRDGPDEGEEQGRRALAQGAPEKEEEGQGDGQGQDILRGKDGADRAKEAHQSGVEEHIGGRVGQRGQRASHT